MITEQLRKNKDIFHSILVDVDKDFIYWRPRPDKWCLLEIVCHLYDEECLDFKFRSQWILEQPGIQPPPFNPIHWITAHKYIDQDYNTMLIKFLNEREKSIDWLKKLKDPKWDSTYDHPKQGPISAKFYLDNWLAHDYLHIRQIIKQKFDYLNSNTNESLDYAGIW